MVPNLGLGEAINRFPLTVHPQVQLSELVNLMSQVQGEKCQLKADPDQQLLVSDNASALALSASQSSSVLVLDGELLVGIVTERDLVRLAATGQSLNGLTAEAVMTQPVITLRQDQKADIFTALNILRQHRIRHLPIVDVEGHLVGLITPESLRRLLQWTDLLHIWQVGEVMHNPVITAVPTATILEVAQLMTEQQVSCIVLANPPTPDNPLSYALGVITERDIIQFQTLEVNLAYTLAASVMSTPLVTVDYYDSLWSAHQMMQSHGIRRLIVTGDQGELQGILTQSSILQVLDPSVLCEVLQGLQHRVSRLESAQTVWLKQQNLELERQVQERTQVLQRQMERERLIASVAQQIRQSLQLESILNTAVTAVRDLLHSDRILVYRFNQDMSGQIIAEALGDGWVATLGDQICDTCFQQGAAERYQQGHYWAVDDIEQAQLTDCHLQLLRQFQVRANIVVPILMSDGHLWGLLVAHQCSAPRQWQADEIDILHQLSVQLVIAIQQADAYEQLQAELTERDRMASKLQLAEQQLSLALNLTETGTWNWHIPTNQITANETALQFFEIPPEQKELSCQDWLDRIYPDDLEYVEQTLAQALDTQTIYEVDYRIIRTDGSIRWLHSRGHSVYDENGHPLQMLGVMFDISERKQVQAELEQTSALNQSILQTTTNGIEALDLNGKVLACNSKFCEIWKLPQDFKEGSDDYQTILQAAQRLTAPEPFISQVEWEQEHPDATCKGVLEFKDGRIIERYSRPLYINNSIIGRLICADDVTGRESLLRELRKTQSDLQLLNYELERKVEERTFELQMSEGLLRKAYSQLSLHIENSPLGYMVWDSKYVILQWSKQAEVIFGWAANEVVGKPWDSWKFIYEKDLDYVNDIFQQFDSGEIDHCISNNRNYTKSGNILHCEWYISVQRNEVGQVISGFAQVLNVTLRKQLEESLRLSEERWQMAVEGSNDGIWDWDLLTGEFFYSRRCKEILGYSEHEISNHLEEWKSLIHPEDEAKVNAAVDTYWCGGTSAYIAEFRMRHKDGSYRWILSRGKSRFDDQGQPLRMTGSHTDITERKQAEEILQCQIAAIEAAIDGIAILEGERFTYLNHAHMAMFGHTPEELIGQAWEALYPPEECKRLRQEVFPLLMQNRHWQGEAIALRKDGSRFFEGLSLTLTPNHELICVCRDISAQKQAEQSLQESEKRYRQIVETAGEGIWMIDAEGRTTFANQQMAKMLGLSPDAMLGLTIFDFMDETASQEAIYYLQRREQGIKEQHDFRFKHQDGLDRWFLIETTPIWDEHQQYVGALGMLTDITDRKQAEEQLQRTNQALEITNAELLRATRLKDEFLANMSHELRTPLNTILGLSGVLLEESYGSLNPKQSKAVQSIERGGFHLLELINDILDIAKIEAGMLELEIAPVQLHYLCHSSLSLVRQTACQKDIQLNLELTQTSIQVWLDERRMRQVLVNLLSNAVKFTPQGGQITLTGAVVPETNELHLKVTDTGIGIAPENIDRLFKPFVQLDSSLSRHYSGTGLGLALVHQIVTLHSGTITVKSQINIGSQFEITLPNLSPSPLQNTSPCHPLSQDHPTQATHPSSSTIPLTPPLLHTPLILLVDDNLENLSICNDYLDFKGFQVITSTNGKDTIELCKAHRPDLILMDIQMPEIDGFEAIRQIRSTPDLTRTVIIALTALAMPDDKARCLEAGATDYVAKPLQLKSLAEKIQSYFVPDDSH